ncbi:MAG: hypothetical protein AAFN93_22345, partial [Bacteroidota bacterium]
NNICVYAIWRIYLLYLQDPSYPELKLGLGWVDMSNRVVWVKACAYTHKIRPIPSLNTVTGELVSAFLTDFLMICCVNRSLSV